MRASALFIAASLLLPLAHARAEMIPTVDKILKRYANAMGGKAAFEKVNTMVFHGTIEFPANKLSGTTTEYFKAPNLFLAVTEVSGYGTVRTGYDGTSGWSQDRKGNVESIEGPALADVRRRANILWHVKLKELYPHIQLKGRENIEGEDAWVLEDKDDGWVFDLCFDAKTGLLVRFDTDTGQPNGSSKVLISDYRPVGDVKFSYGAEMITDKVVWIRKLTDLKFNVPVNDQLFEIGAGHSGST
jgi:hypothetical protein